MLAIDEYIQGQGKDVYLDMSTPSILERYRSHQRVIQKLLEKLGCLMTDGKPDKWVHFPGRIWDKGRQKTPVKFVAINYLD